MLQVAQRCHKVKGTIVPAAFKHRALMQLLWRFGPPLVPLLLLSRVSPADFAR